LEETRLCEVKALQPAIDVLLIVQARWLVAGGAALIARSPSTRSTTDAIEGHLTRRVADRREWRLSRID